MRVWTRQWVPEGRVPDGQTSRTPAQTRPTQKRTWVAVEEDQALVAWLQNALLLELGESPFNADWGIPVTQSLVTRLWPTYYLDQTVQRFRGYFASLQVAPTPNASSGTTPDYTLSIILANGTPYPSTRARFNQTFSQTGPSTGYA